MRKAQAHTMLTVLIIDDDETFRRTLARRLTRRGHSVTHVGTPAEAREAILGQQPAVIVLDLRLAEASGLDLLPELRAGAPASRILVLSGFASVAATVAAMRAGADDVLAKPVDIETLLAAAAGRSASADPDWTPLSPERAEWEHIQRVLHEYAGNISATARALGMHRRTLQRKLAKHSPR
ncbi:response regulator transcription factor [Arhodomonas sp. AD133]|uniref:response regulator transcription factor n=1 Tax=Arhodomonas sp. AD133 TaxID=3415009 RepID=UPI003EB78C61